MVLLRHLLGDALRRLRLRQGRTLREVSASARVSLGYLSEVERGQKEASSELLAAICSALGAPLSQVLREVSDGFALAELQSEPVFAGVIEPGIDVAAGHGAGQDAEAAPVGSAAPAPLHPAAAGSAPAADRMSVSAGHLSGGHKLTVPGGPRLPLTTGIRVGGPVFEQVVTRTAREITNMVPV
jgi:XRE family transcriptional regulator, stress-response regulator